MDWSMRPDDVASDGGVPERPKAVDRQNPDWDYVKESQMLKQTLGEVAGRGKCLRAHMQIIVRSMSDCTMVLQMSCFYFISSINS